MNILLQAAIVGVLMSGVYALMSSGLVITYGVMRIINLAQGAFVILGAYLTMVLYLEFNIDPMVSILITAPVMFLLGMALQQLLLRPLTFKRQALSVLMCWAMALGIEGGLLFAFGSDVRSILPSYVNDGWLIGDIRLTKVRVYAFALSVVALALLYLILYRTPLGRSIRATSEQPEAAKLIGINTERVSAFAFGLGAATGAMGGAMFGLIIAFYPASHLAILGKLLTVVVLGGLGSLRGALVAALLLGVSEAVVQIMYSPAWSLFPFYLLLLVIVAYRPQGLFGEKGVRTV